MADSAVAITAGTGTNIDTRTEGTNSNHRQVIVVGDPSTNAGVAPVDGTAGLKVDLGSDNDVTVTGTVTANLSATDNAVLDAIQTAVEIIDNVVSGSEAQVDIVAALPAGTNEIGSVRSQTADTGTASQIADNAADTTILAANADRRGAAVYNSSSATLYLLCASGTASSTNFTVAIVPNGYFEVPAGYTGILKGIWASDPGDGLAHVTEWDNA